MPIDVRKEARAKPDRSRLREVAAEFELRQVVQRLDEEFLEDVPDRAVEETLVVEAEEGTPADLADGPISIAVAAGIWAASDGDRVVTGDASDLVELAEQLRGRPLIAHDAKSQGGGGREGLLAVAPPGSLDLKHDTMVAAYLIDPARRVYDLNELAADAGLAAAPAGADPGQLSLAAEEGEAAGDPTTDARLVIELAARQRGRLAEFGLERLLNDVEMPLIEVLAAMERAGVKLDAERLAEIGAGMAERIAQLESEIFELAGHEFTIGSPQQLGEVLFDELGLTKKRRGKTGFSTDARVLAQIRDEHEIVAKVESWRELTKLKNTYLDALPELIDPETGRIHTTFNQVATTTGRLSSINPNLQNIPIRSEIGRPVRACFVAERGNAAAVGRLQPGRAAGARPRRRRGRAARDLRLGRGRAPRHRRRGAGDLRPRRSAPPSARRRRWSTTGSPTGCRRSGSRIGCRSPARRRRSTSSATSSASRP